MHLICSIARNNGPSALFGRLCFNEMLLATCILAIPWLGCRALRAFCEGGIHMNRVIWRSVDLESGNEIHTQPEGSRRCPVKDLCGDHACRQGCWQASQITELALLR